MQLRFLLPVAVLATTLALAGCTAPDEPTAAPSDLPTPTVTPSDTGEEDEPLPEPTSSTATYASIDELSAAVACDDFEVSDAPAGATAAGTCGSQFILLLFATAADRDTYVNADQATDKPGTFLIGANWVVQLGPKGTFEDLQPLLTNLGGFVVPTGS